MDEMEEKTMEDTKSISILLVLNTLREYSDENHALTQADIIEKISANYDILLDRRTIKKYISILQSMGYDINQKSRKGGVYLLSRELDRSQVQFLIDAIFSSKNITGKQAKKLSSALYGMLSKYQRKKFSYLYKSESVNRNNDSDFFLNIEIINEAIEKKKKITFQYADYDEKGKEIFRYDNHVYEVSPYFLVNNFGKYYLLCNSGKYSGFTNYRVDYLRNVKMSTLPLTPKEKILPDGKFNIYDYLNEHVYIFGGVVSDCKVLVLDKKAIAYIKDWFGKNAEIERTNDTTIASFQCDEMAFYYWCLQYGDNIEVLEPQSVKERLAEAYHRISDRYHKTFLSSEHAIEIQILLKDFLNHHFIRELQEKENEIILSDYLSRMIPNAYQVERRGNQIQLSKTGDKTILVSYYQINAEKDFLVDFLANLHSLEEQKKNNPNEKHYALLVLKGSIDEQENVLKDIFEKSLEIKKNFSYEFEGKEAVIFNHNYRLERNGFYFLDDKEIHFFIIEVR